jgi:hypothetical protein
MTRPVAIVGIVAIAVAYFIGFWPQYRQLTAARTQVETLQASVTAAEARLRLADVLGHLLRLSDAVDARNYGDAAMLASTFFDSVRTEVSRADDPEARATLQRILDTRDRVTTAIAAMDATLPSALKQHERALRQALGFAVSAAS